MQHGERFFLRKYQAASLHIDEKFVERMQKAWLVDDERKSIVIIVIEIDDDFVLRQSVDAERDRHIESGRVDDARHQVARFDSLQHIVEHLPAAFHIKRLVELGGHLGQPAGLHEKLQPVQGKCRMNHR